MLLVAPFRLFQSDILVALSETLPNYGRFPEYTYPKDPQQAEAKASGVMYCTAGILIPKKPTKCSTVHIDPSNQPTFT